MSAFSERKNSNKVGVERDFSRDLWSSKLLIPSLMIFVLVAASALGVIYSSFKSRQLFSVLQLEIREAVQLEEEWGRLLLEQSTWASHTRVEQLAKRELNMIVPESIVLIAVSP